MSAEIIAASSPDPEEGLFFLGGGGDSSSIDELSIEHQIGEATPIRFLVVS